METGLNGPFGKTVLKFPMMYGNCQSPEAAQIHLLFMVDPVKGMTLNTPLLLCVIQVSKALISYNKYDFLKTVCFQLMENGPLGATGAAVPTKQIQQILTGKS